jgi:hypothetical protein
LTGLIGQYPLGGVTWEIAEAYFDSAKVLRSRIETAMQSEVSGVH